MNVLFIWPLLWFWLAARTLSFIDLFVGFTFVTAVAEAHRGSSSARLLVSGID